MASKGLKIKVGRVFGFRRVMFTALVLLLCSVLLPRITAAVWSQNPAADEAGKEAKKENSRAEFVPGEVLVRFRQDAPGGKNTARTNMTLDGGARAIDVRVEPFAVSESVGGLRLAHVEPEDTLAAVEALNRRPDVLYAEPNYILRKAALPNDPRFSELWGLRNPSSQTADIDAEQAWDTTTGSRNVVVGVIDEGIDVSHEDLRDNIWHNAAEAGGTPNFDDDGNGYVDDINGWDFFNNDRSVYDGPGTNLDGSPTDGHGTHVAGTIGASGNNGKGVVGVNWQVSLLPLKFLGPEGGSTADAIRAYDYARAMRLRWDASGGTQGANIRVLNNSYGGRGFSQAALDAIRALGDAGILFVTSAGNEARNNDRFRVYPTGYQTPNMVTVGASGLTGFPATQFTNYGQRSVDLIAPGEHILSTTPGNTYDIYEGTSMAAPHAAGTAALVCAAYPNISLRRLRAALIYGGSPGFVQFTSSGKRLNARGSLDNAAETDTTAPAVPANLSISSQGNQKFALQWNAPGDDGTGGASVAIYEVRYSDADPNAPGVFDTAYALVAPAPAAPGSVQTTNVTVPYRHATGFISVRAIDNAGNASPLAVVNISADIAEADPYTFSVAGAGEALSTGGTPLGLRADDAYTTYQLPFEFTFFGQRSGGVGLSTNGAIHFIYPSQLPNGSPDVDVSGTDFLSARHIIAGVWDDLRTDRRAGDDIYVLQPDPERVIFRWQAVTYNPAKGPGAGRGENPVNFEIELRRDGSFLIRYGEGNHNLLPVVGASGGEPDPYIVASHTSEFALKDLSFAPVVTFTRRRPIPPPAPDLSVGVRTTPNPAASGQQLIYQIEATNRTFDQTAERVTVISQLPQGVGFVSCTTTQGTCSGPAVGSTGTVAVNINRLAPSFSTATISIVVQVNAPPGSTLNSTTTISNYWNDPNPANNSVTLATPVLSSAVFGGVRAISAGGSSNGGHTLALKSDGTIWAWGFNIWGQLGDGFTYGSVNVPVQVVNLGDVVAVEAGGEHSLALKSDGTVWAWGSNYNGQAGAREQFTFSRTSPVQVAGLDGVFKAIAAGADHSLALKTDGTIWAWGNNSSGQLGHGAAYTETVDKPVQVAGGLTNVAGIAAGSRFSLAVRNDGTIWAWGANTSGVLGRPSDTFSVGAPVQVAGIADVVAVSAGERHALALKRDGTVWAWGDNFEGRLGNGETGFGSTPRPVGGLASVREINAGSGHSIALKGDGTVWTWGRNVTGVLGDGTTNNRSVPVQVVGLGGVSSIAGGFEHNGALLPDGTIRMWGANNNGQLGDRTIVSRSTPTGVSGPYGVETPVFSPGGGTFSFTQGVMISCATQGVVIHYTTDGSEPTENDPPIISNSTVFVERTMTLKAKAFKQGWAASAVKSAEFILPPKPPVPTPTPVPGAAGQPIAFARLMEQSGSDIFLMNPDGSAQVNITNMQGEDHSPTWSPDGKKIAFASRRGYGGASKIYSMNLDGTEPRNLSGNFADDDSPAWSPDGKQIAFRSVTNGFPIFIYVMNADGTGRRRLNNIQSAGSPAWSPDGQSIAFTAPPGDIWVARLDGSSIVRLTNNSWDDQTPVYSPDGTKIAFVSNRHGDVYNHDIYVMNADGTNPVRLTDSPGRDGAPSWSPDGSKIIFGSLRDGPMNTEIYVMNADGTNQTRITNNTAHDGSAVWRPQMSPTVQFSSATYSAPEGGGAASVTVTRKGDARGVVSVDYTTVDETASANSDYTAASGTITFNAGETSKTFSVSILEDTQAEELETLALRLSNPTGGAELGSPAVAVLGINDNEPCSNSISPANHTSPASGETLSVNVTARGGCDWTAVSNSNFIGVSSGASGSGNGVVRLSILSNGSGVPRVGTATIAGQTLTITQPELIPQASILQFSAASYESGEAAGSATLTLTRLGDKTGTASIRYRTVDDPAAVPCDPNLKRPDGTSYPQGAAYARCDYATSIDTLTFLPGEETKQFSIPLIDDVYAEGAETLLVRLSDPVGALLSETNGSATLVIRDNDTMTGSSNPSRDTSFFVRMHYLDFLSREPEAGEPWSAVLNRCPNPFNLDAQNPSAGCDRLIVSQSFFGSPEFRLKGIYTYTFYRVGLKRRPTYEEIIPDMRNVTGRSGEEVFRKRAEFASAFGERAEFRALYGALTDAAYVNALLDGYGVEQITTPDPQNPEGESKVRLTRAELVNRLGAPAASAQALTRAQVLRALVESDEVGAAEYNGAFVAMQYYGYLRRTPEESGYQAWLRVINQDPQNIRIMVNGFLNSTEYRIRFGLP